MEKICVVESNLLKSKDVLNKLPISRLAENILEKEKNFDLEKDVNFKQLVV